MQPEISVIMPVYNIENYIAQAIESIIEQTYKNFELIILDDKSTDKTLEIAQKYAKKDARIRIFALPERKKQGEGRNRGIQEALGKYIMFLDGDDIAQKNFLEKMYDKIIETNADIVMCNFQTLDDKDGKISDNHVFGQLKNISEKMLQNGFSPIEIKSQIFTIPNVIWNKIYNRSYLLRNNLKFPGVITMCEDIIFGINAILKSEKLAFVNENLMLYRINRPNASSGSKDDAFFDVFKQYEILRENFKDMGIYESIKVEFIVDAIYTMLFFLERIKFSFKSQFFDRMRKIFQIYYNEEFSTKEKILQFDPTTYFHVNRVIKNSYLKYTVLNIFDKFFRIEPWFETKTVVLFNKKEFYINNKK